MSDTTPMSEVQAAPPATRGDTDTATAVLPAVRDTSPDADVADREPHNRAWLTWTVRSLMVATVVGLGALSAYLWTVNGEWTSQNEQLRAEALALGETLAQERITTQTQAAELDLVSSQLENATDRISDLANEEANAVDDRKVIENLAENFRDCADSRQELIDVLTNSRMYFPGKTNQQVENDITEYCEEIEDIHDDYLDDRNN